MDHPSLDRTLLFGILALQVDLIDGDQFVAAMVGWEEEGTRTLGQILVEQGSLTPGFRDSLEPMVEAHIERHGGEATRSLASLSSTDQVRVVLERVAGAGPGLREGLTRLGDETADLRVKVQSTIDLRGDRKAADRPSVEPAGRFRVLRPHARGGLGQVYVAQDNELGRRVALKEILADKAGNAALRSRFMLEAEINGNLEHPGIVPVYGLGTYGDGRPFYAMRFIEGDSLREAIRRLHDARLAGDPSSRRPFDSLEFRQLLRRFVDVCNAIAYAHSRGVLHRDLKPANVMLGQYGETLIIDWGLAKATGRADPGVGEPSGRPLLPTSGSSIDETEAGSVLGTPGYMSPEQASGRLEDLGPSSDIYSLGATLFVVLTGQSPVEDSDVVQILTRVQTGAIDTPRSVAPGVPRPLEAICLKALALRPEDRYQKANELADDVERWLADEPVSADREPWADRLRRWGRHHRTLVATAATATVLALVGLGVVAAVQTRATRDLSAKNFQLLVANEARGWALDKANSRVDVALQALGRFREAVDANLDVKNRPENAPLRDELLQAPLAFFRTLRDDLRDDPAARSEDRLKLADAQLELARLTVDIGNQASALEAVGEAVETLDALAEARPPGPSADLARRKLLDALTLQASLQTDNGRRDLAKVTIERGIKLGEAVVAGTADLEPRIGLAKLLVQSAAADQAATRVAAALTTLDRAAKLVEGVRPGPDETPRVLRLRAVVLGEVANLQSNAGKPKQSIEALRAAVGLVRPLAEGPWPDWTARGLLGDFLVNIGIDRRTLGQGAEAIDDFKAGLEIRRRMLAERPTNLDNRLRASSALRQIANARNALGQAEAGLEDLREARALLESARQENPRNVRVLQGLVGLYPATGGSLYALGRTAESLASFEQSVPVLEELGRIEPNVTKNRTNLAGNLYNIAVLRKVVGRNEASLEADLAALAIRRKLAAEFPGQPDLRLNLAASLGNIGATLTDWKRDHEAALAYYEETCSLLEDLARAHPEVETYATYLRRNRSNLAGVQSRLGRFEAALAVERANLPYLEGRVTAQPALVQARLDLALNLTNQAVNCVHLRREAEADRLNLRGLEVLEGIPEGSRGSTDVVLLFVDVFKDLGMSAAHRGDLAGAVGRYDRAISTVQPDPSKAPADDKIRERLRNSLARRAEALARLRRPDGARADWSRLLALAKPGEPDLAPFWSPLLRAWTGDGPGFLTEARAAVASGLARKDELILLAQTACGAIRDAGADAALARRLGDAAIDWLHSAQDDGAFAAQGSWNVLIDPEFDPIAGRPEFRLLKADAAFPARPFAPEPPAP